MRSCLTTLIFIFILFPLLSCQNNKPKGKSIQEVALSINTALAEARKGLEVLCEKSARYYDQKVSHVPSPMAPHYKYYEGTAYYKDEDDGLCGLWASGFTPIGKKEQEEIQFLEGLQPTIKEYADSHEIVALAHLLTTDHVGIFYPYFNGVSFFEPRVNFYEAFMPFYNVAPDKNPHKETRWIEPYIDAAGNGYICSVSSPVYQANTFKASIGADIPLLAIGKRFLADNKQQMIVTSESTVVYATPTLVKEIPIKALDEFYYTKHVIIDEAASSEFQLTKSSHPEIRMLADAIKKGSKSLVIEGKTYSIEAVQIDETTWHAVELTVD